MLIKDIFIKRRNNMGKDINPSNEAGNDNEEIKRAKQDLTLLDLQKDLELKKQGFKDIQDFDATKRKSDSELEKRGKELDDRERALEDREKMITDREAQVVTGAEKNKLVEENIRKNILVEYKKNKKVIEYARLKYFTNLDTLRQKLTNCKVGVDYRGIRIKDGEKTNWNETICMDKDFQEEVLKIFEPIWKALKASPHFDPETNEYLTEGEFNEPYDDEEEETKEDDNDK
jgi:hypothetical protein